MGKYEIKCALMQGTGIKGKKGDVLELDSKSKRVQDLVKRGWLEEVKAETKEEVKAETKEEVKAETKEPKEAPKKTTKKK